MVKKEHQTIKFALCYCRFKEIEDVPFEILLNKKIQK